MKVRPQLPLLAAPRLPAGPYPVHPGQACSLRICPMALPRAGPSGGCPDPGVSLCSEHQLPRVCPKQTLHRVTNWNAKGLVPTRGQMGAHVAIHTTQRTQP